MEHASHFFTPTIRHKKFEMHALSSCHLLELPVTSYHDVWNLQQAIVESKRDGNLDSDVVLLLEHAPVFTLGRRGGMENLIIPKPRLDRENIEVVQVERGGDITYHGPGQLVAYPIIDLKRRKLGITELVSGLEEIMILSAKDFGVAAERNPRNRGVWVGNKKIGSIGLAVRRGISFHGFAFNVSTSLAHFGWIHPCGLRDIGVTSLKNECDDEPSMPDVRRAVSRHFRQVFDIELINITRKELTKMLKKN
jgi:lipoate-protein ligase B